MFAVLYGALVAVGLTALIVIAMRARELCLRAPIDTTPLASALREARRDDAFAAALRAELAPAWVAELLAAARAASPGPAADDAIDETLHDLRARAVRSLLLVSVLGRVAPPLAFAAAIVTMAAALRHDAGLLSLQKGLAETVAMNHAILAIATGTTISLVCRIATGWLSARGTRLIRDLERCAAWLAESDPSQ